MKTTQQHDRFVDRLLNRVRGLCLLVAIVPVLMIGSITTSAPAAVYSIVTNPAEDCSSAMNIGWHADLASTDSAVTYTAKSDTAWAHVTTIKGTSERCELFNGILSKSPAGADIHEEALFLDYGVTLTELKPDTDYMYKVSAGKDESSVHYFRTAGAKEFSFVWISDIHAYTPIPNRIKNANAVMDAAMAIDKNIAFVFGTGDVVAWGGSYSFWKDLYEQPFVVNYMFPNVLGNHDAMMREKSTTSDYFKAVNNFPLNGYDGQKGVCYWFLYGNALFLTLNTEAMVGKPEQQQAAKDWAASVIDKQKGRYRYVFIAEHYQWFDGRNGKTSWYANWKDFCDEHGVTLAMSGNNHVYERTHPLFQDKVMPNGQGTVYMEAPSSDGERGVEAGPLTLNAEKLAYTYSSHVKSNAKEVKTIGCVLVKVGPEGIATKLVYLDEDRAVHVEDEHLFRPVPASQPAAQQPASAPAAQ